MLGARPVQMCARLPAQMEEVLEARRGHERCPGTASLEERVRSDRRPVGEALDTFHSERGGRRDDRLLLACRRRNLRRAHLAVGDEHGVRERPADVDPERAHRGILSVDWRLDVKSQRQRPRRGRLQGSSRDQSPRERILVLRIAK
jgi:hypothetical protein